MQHRLSFIPYMKAEIAAKLNRELKDEIVSERQVVYILVETRKLLEQQGVLHDFRALKLCSDWAVHPKLQGRDSQIVLKYFDAYEIEYQNSHIAMAEFPLEPLHDFVSYKQFRAEFMDALSSYDVETDTLAQDKFWQSFIQYYACVIQDCPLEAKQDSTELVNRVTAQSWSREMADAIYPGKRVIQWNWTLKSGTEREKIVCALI
jgi:hypothetical protein